MVVVVVRIAFLNTSFKAPYQLKGIVVPVEINVAYDLVVDTSPRSVLCSVSSRTH